MAGVTLGFAINGVETPASEFGYRASRILYNTAERLSPEGMTLLFEGLSKELEVYFDANWPMHVAPRLPQTNVRWPDGSTLDLTTSLKKSLTSRTPDSVRDITPMGIRFGTRLYYARFINDGTTKMQPRPFLRMTVKLRALFVGQIKEYVGFNPDLRFKSGFRGL